MKATIVLTLAAMALFLSGCESMYVGGSVGTLADNGYRPKFLPASEVADRTGYVCHDEDCVRTVHAE